MKALLYTGPHQVDISAAVIRNLRSAWRQG